jgi:hypothetical protein
VIPSGKQDWDERKTGNNKVRKRVSFFIAFEFRNRACKIRQKQQKVKWLSGFPLRVDSTDKRNGLFRNSNKLFGLNKKGA